MSKISTKISDDLIFHAVYKTFTAKFNQFTYQTSDDAVAVYDGTLLVCRLFFLKDLSETVRFIQLIVGRASDISLFNIYFKNELKAYLDNVATDIYEKADIQLTTFEIYPFDLSDADLATSKIKLTGR